VKSEEIYGYLTELSNFMEQFLGRMANYAYLCRKFQKHENQPIQETSHH
jgi:hypothetical protein